MSTTLWEGGLCDAEYSAIGEPGEDDDCLQHPERVLLNRLGVLLAAALIEDLQRQGT